MKPHDNSLEDDVTIYLPHRTINSSLDTRAWIQERYKDIALQYNIYLFPYAIGIVFRRDIAGTKLA